MRHIFWNTYNTKIIAQSLDQENGRLLLVAGAEKNRSFIVIKSIAVDIWPAK